MRLRIVILLLTILALIRTGMDRLPASRLVQTDYCWVDFYGAAKDNAGELHRFWTQGWGPCSQLDRYENI